MVDVKNTALFRFLHNHDALYYGNLIELTEILREWLAYIPHTFPHYTRHTLGHSEEIIAQLSHVLFRDGIPTIGLSRVEAYILCLAAYLHDAGMVCSDEEKRRILENEEWKNWISQGGGGELRWTQAAHLRTNHPGTSSDVANFLADVQVRYLISEFVRARHHLRAGDLIIEQQPALGRFAFDDPMLLQTLSDVCVAHGIECKDLEDPTRFPE